MNENPNPQLCWGGWSKQERVGYQQKASYVKMRVVSQAKLKTKEAVQYGQSKFMGYLKGKSTLMIYDRHPELQSKWDKAFWARGYYVSTIGNITEDAIKKYIQEQAEESRKEDSRGTSL